MMAAVNDLLTDGFGNCRSTASVHCYKAIADLAGCWQAPYWPFLWPESMTRTTASPLQID